MGDTPRIPARIRGTLRGASFDADGAVRIVDDLVSIHVADREHTMRIDRVDGVVWEAPVLTVHVAQDVIALTGHAGLQPFGAQIVSTALALPEFTRTMRGLGSRRAYRIGPRPFLRGPPRRAARRGGFCGADIPTRGVRSAASHRGDHYAPR